MGALHQAILMSPSKAHSSPLSRTEGTYWDHQRRQPNDILALGTRVENEWSENWVSGFCRQ